MSFFKQEKLFSEEECKYILEKYTLLDKGLETEDAGGKRFSFVPINESEDNWLLDRLIKWAMKETQLDFDWFKAPKENKEFWMLSYGPEDIFKKHIDDVLGRKFTVGLLLNNDFIGGDFLCYENNSVHRFYNIIGNCYIFSSDLVHEVRKIIIGERHVVLMFINETQIN